jgi:hypothetical protein
VPHHRKRQLRDRGTFPARDLAAQLARGAAYGLGALLVRLAPTIVKAIKL